MKAGYFYIGLYFISMQLNITISSLSGILIAVNEASINGSGTYNITPQPVLIGQHLTFFISGCTVTGNTISFTDSYGKSWSQQITQTTGLIKRSGSYTGGTIQGIVLEPVDPMGLSMVEGYYNPYTGQTPIDITETWTGTNLVVDFSNCELLPTAIINVSIS